MDENALICGLARTLQHAARGIQASEPAAFAVAGETILFGRARLVFSSLC
jgi:hypothetical protein